MRKDRIAELKRIAGSGGLSQDQKLQLIGQLAYGDQYPTETYAAISALAETHDPTIGPLLRPLLRSVKHPEIAGKALQTLCLDLGLSEEFEPEIVEFVRGVDWDTADDVRLTAIACAGAHLTKSDSSALLEALVRIASDANERSLIKEAAVEALKRAAGLDWNALGTMTASEAISQALSRLRQV